MYIYRDLASGEEYFSDSYKMGTCGENGCILTLEGKMEQRGADQIQIDGANPSQEEQAEDLDDSGVTSGIDIVLNHKLEDVSTFFDKKSLKGYLKKWAKFTADKLKDDADAKKKFMEGCKEALQPFVELYDPDNSSVFALDEFGQYFGDGGCAIGIVSWNDDGKGVVFHFIKAGLFMEKA